MSYEYVTFRRGPLATMPTDNVAGTLLIASDTGDCFLDTSDSNRIRLIDSTKLPLAGGAVEGAIKFKNTESDAISLSISSDTMTFYDENVKNRYKQALEVPNPSDFSIDDGSID